MSANSGHNTELLLSEACVFKQAQCGFISKSAQRFFFYLGAYLTFTGSSRLKVDAVNNVFCRLRCDLFLGEIASRTIGIGI